MIFLLINILKVLDFLTRKKLEYNSNCKDCIIKCHICDDCNNKFCIECNNYCEICRTELCNQCYHNNIC